MLFPGLRFELLQCNTQDLKNIHFAVCTFSHYFQMDASSELNLSKPQGPLEGEFPSIG